MKQVRDFSSVFDQIAPRCYCTSCLSGVLSEDDTAFIRFHRRPIPDLHDIEIREIACRCLSQAPRKRTTDTATAASSSSQLSPYKSEFVPVFRAAIWTASRFSHSSTLRRRWAVLPLPRHRQLRFGEPSWKSMVRHGSVAPSESSTVPADPSKRDVDRYSVQFDQQCAYAAESCGPPASKTITTPPGRFTQLLVQVSTPGTDDVSCTRFCTWAAQAWILTMTLR
ncbi:hypothetical protein Micbo1qcDRAFT_180958, partial [Microdochium bolleyi]